ncbi:MAG: hypothetical protein HUJ68_13065 [Clostridia bacterium]|nr:hypothetical protein [Clostridia bacterium]
MLKTRIKTYEKNCIDFYRPQWKKFLTWHYFYNFEDEYNYKSSKKRIVEFARREPALRFLDSWLKKQEEIKKRGF